MSNSKTVINIVIVILLLGAILIGYFYFFGGNKAETNTQSGLQQITANGSTGLASVGQSQASEFVVLLDNLRSVDLKSSIFSNPAFSGDLQDFTTPLPDRQKGRSNPFAPIGTSNISATPVSIGGLFR